MSAERRRIILFLVVFLRIFLNNQHLTIILIQLEILALIVLITLSCKMIILESSLTAIYIILRIVVIEAAVGLRLIVKHSRFYRKELIKFFV